MLIEFKLPLSKAREIFFDKKKQLHVLYLSSLIVNEMLVQLGMVVSLFISGCKLFKIRVTSRNKNKSVWKRLLAFRHSSLLQVQRLFYGKIEQF